MINSHDSAAIDRMAILILRIGVVDSKAQDNAAIGECVDLRSLSESIK